MNFEEEVRKFTCKFPGLELHQFCFDGRWFDAQAFFESCSRRLQWVNFIRARQTIIQSAQIFGATADPIAMYPQKLSLALNMLNASGIEILFPAKLPLEPSASFIKNNQDDTFIREQGRKRPLNILSQIAANPDTAAVSLSEKNRSIAAALIYIQACFLLADNLASYCNDHTTVIPFARLLNKSEAARTLINEMDKTGMMIIDDFSSRLLQLQAQFEKVRPRPPRHLPQISWSAVTGASGIVLLSAAVFIFLVSPHTSTEIPFTNEQAEKPAPPVNPRQIPDQMRERLAGGEKHSEKKFSSSEDVIGVQPEQPPREQKKIFDPDRQAIDEAVPKDPGGNSANHPDVKEATTPLSHRDMAANSSSADDTLPLTTPKRSEPGPGIGQESSGPDDNKSDSEPEQDKYAEHPSTKPQMANDNVITLLDSQDLILLNRYIEYGKSNIYYLWGNRSSRLLFDAKPEPARRIDNNYICRDVVLMARPDSDQSASPHYLQRTTFCRDFDRPVWRLLR